MLQLRRRFLGLCLLPILLTCLDDGLTLSQQSREYWAGDYSKAHEGNPWYYHLLAEHPVAFIAWESASLLVFTGMILMLPQTLALTISIAFTLGYTVGTSTWLLYGGFSHGHEMFCGLCLVTAASMALGIRWGWRAVPESDAPAGARLPFALRWLVILVLSGIAIYMNLWPHSP
jgi:hypothetical protein